MTQLLMPPSPSSPPITTLRSTSVCGEYSPRAPSALPYSCRKASSCTPLSFPTFSPPSLLSPIALSLVTSPTARVALTISLPRPSVLTSSSTMATVALSPSTPHPSHASTSSSTSRSTRVASSRPLHSISPPQQHYSLLAPSNSPLPSEPSSLTWRKLDSVFRSRNPSRYQQARFLVAPRRESLRLTVRIRP